MKAGATHSGQDLAALNKRLHTLQCETDQAIYLVNSFKLLVEKLDGMIPEQAAALPAGTDGVFAYRFPRASGSTWIVWSDVGTWNVELPLEGVPDGPVTVTEGVPRFSAPFQTPENKLDAAQYPAFFTSTSVSVVGGKIRFTVEPLPLVIAPTPD